MTRGGKSYYYLTDALGSTVGMVIEAGKKTASYYYSPRGVTEATEDNGKGQPYRFASTYQDATAMYHMGARYYDPRIGRFTQPDPSGQEENPYLYANGDPVNHIDPNGLFSVGEAFSGAVSKVGNAVSAGKFLGDIKNGNWKGAAKTAASWAGGTVTGGTCTAVAGAFGVATGGAGLVTMPACVGAGAFGSYAAGDFVERQF